MSLPDFLVNTLKLGSWPVLLRKPFVTSMIRRKSLTSLPFTTRYRGFVFSGDAANMIDYHVLSRGGFEPGLTELLIIWGKSHGEGVFLDVGANVGVHTLGAASAYRQVLAIEPFPSLVERLKKTISVNPLANVKVIRTALADSTGTVAFRAPIASNLGTGSIVGADSASGGDVIEVPLAIGDDLLAAEGLPLSCAKIDTEGAEKRVLAGLARSLASDRPLVIFELLEAGSENPDALKELFPQDYSFFLLEDIRSKNFRLAPWNRGHGDVVAVPSEKIETLRRFVK